MIRLDREGPLALLRLDKARGNAIDEPLSLELIRVSRELDADDSVRGVFLGSAHPKLFCPGLDLVSLIEYDRPTLERFMRVFTEAVWALYFMKKPVVAGISGHAVAGGCILALTADYRILRRGGVQIGLNELKIGVPLPWSVVLLLRASVPPTSLATTALLGSNPTDEAAVAAGLAHTLADAEGFTATCLEKLRDFADRDPQSFAITKSYLRGDVLREMRAHEAEEADLWLDCWFSKPTQERIRKIVSSLGSRA